MPRWETAHSILNNIKKGRVHCHKKNSKNLHEVFSSDGPNGMPNVEQKSSLASPSSKGVLSPMENEGVCGNQKLVTEIFSGAPYQFRASACVVKTHLTDVFAKLKAGYKQFGEGIEKSTQGFRKK